MPTVLIADSKAADRALLFRALERLGWHVVAASTAGAAVRAITTLAVDVVVASTDLAMQGSPSLWEHLCNSETVNDSRAFLVLPWHDEHGLPPSPPAGARNGVRWSTRLNTIVVALCESIHSAAASTERHDDLPEHPRPPRVRRASWKRPPARWRRDAGA
jgi:hypothetical protein